MYRVVRKNQMKPMYKVEIFDILTKKSHNTDINIAEKIAIRNTRKSVVFLACFKSCYTHPRFYALLNNPNALFSDKFEVCSKLRNVQRRSRCSRYIPSTDIFFFAFRARRSAHFLNGCCVICSICSAAKINYHADR